MSGGPTHGNEPPLRRARVVCPVSSGDSKLYSQTSRTAPAVLAACLIAAGLFTLATATDVAALTHIPNLDSMHVQPGTRTRTKKQNTRGTDKMPFPADRIVGKPADAVRLPRIDIQESDASRPALIRVAGSISWGRPASCLNGTLKSVLRQAAGRFGHIHVTSTCRSRARNRRAGGARHSHHIGGNAVDFRIRGNYGAAKSFLRHHPGVGGYKHYGGGRFHIDTGPRRTW